MQDDVSISFVIPAYNEVGYIERTLEAVLREAGDAPCPTEVIVVDNASTDRTGEIAASFPGVRVVDEPVKGLVAARRAGFLAARGSLIANVDADTILPRGWIGTVVASFARDPRLVAVSGPYVYYDVPWHTRALVRVFYYSAFVTYALNRHVLRVGSMMQGGNFVVRRDALEAIGGFSDAFSFYGEDTDLARRLSAVGKVRFTARLRAYSSGRRLIKEGVIKVFFDYSLNYFWTTFFHRPYTNAWTDHRPRPGAPPPAGDARPTFEEGQPEQGSSRPV